MRMDGLLQYSARIPSVQAPGTTKPAQPQPAPQGGQFAEILQKQLESTEKLKFTKHAQERLIQRDIRLTEEALEKLDQAVEKAAQKGVKDTLVLMDNMAFIVSVVNKTVVTAMKDQDITGNVFTQIDGAVVI